MSDNKHMPTVELLHLAKVLEGNVLDQENSPKQRKVTRSCGFRPIDGTDKEINTTVL
jgi:hypothetical protein